MRADGAETRRYDRVSSDPRGGTTCRVSGVRPKGLTSRQAQTGKASAGRREYHAAYTVRSSTVAEGTGDNRGQGRGRVQEAFEFRVEVGDRGATGYQLLVREHGGSLIRAVLELDVADLRDHLSILETCVVASGARTRRASSPDEARIQYVGGHLFRRLFAGELSGLLRATRNEAQRAGKHVRVVLQIEPPELAGLPWEFLYNAEHDEYLAKACLLVRNPMVPTPEQPLRVESPIRILAMSAAPSNLPKIDVEDERARLEEALAEATASGHAELHWVPGETKHSLLDTLRRGPWHVFHFIGHGDFDEAAGQGTLALTGPDGRADAVTASQLSSAFGNHPAMRMVVLNACRSARSSTEDAFSGLAAALVRRSMPAVVAMQYEISDPAALEFSRALYGAIADGEPVDFAVRFAREAVSWAQNGTLEWGTPVLFLRAPDGRIFDIADAGRVGPVVHPAPVPADHHTGAAPKRSFAHESLLAVRGDAHDGAHELPDATPRHRHTHDEFLHAVNGNGSTVERAAVWALLAHAERRGLDVHWGAGSEPSATPSFATAWGRIYPWSIHTGHSGPRFAVNLHWIHERGNRVPDAVVRRFAERLAAGYPAAAKFSAFGEQQWRRRPATDLGLFFAADDSAERFLAALDELLDAKAE